MRFPFDDEAKGTRRDASSAGTEARLARVIAGNLLPYRAATARYIHRNSLSSQVALLPRLIKRTAAILLDDTG